MFLVVLVFNYILTSWYVFIQGIPHPKNMILLTLFVSQYTCFFLPLPYWKRSLRRHDHQLTWELEPGNQRLLSPFPALGRYIMPVVPTAGVVSRCSLDKLMCCSKYLDWIYDRTLLKPIYKLFLRFWQAGGAGGGEWTGDLLILWSLRANLICKFPCLLNLPPPNLEGSVSFSGFSLPFVYGSQFVNQQP